MQRKLPLQNSNLDALKCETYDFCDCKELCVSWTRYPAFKTFPFLFPLQNGHVEVQKLIVGFAALYWAWCGRVCREGTTRRKHLCSRASPCTPAPPDAKYCWPTTRILWTSRARSRTASARCRVCRARAPGRPGGILLYSIFTAHIYIYTYTVNIVYNFDSNIKYI